jgi:hypothetical protein
MALIIGNRYVINISITPTHTNYDMLSTHRFFNNRVVTYLGQDNMYTLGESHNFSSDLNLYENLQTDDDHIAFSELLNVCVSHSNNGNWTFYILRDNFQIVSEL